MELVELYGGLNERKRGQKMFKHTAALFVCIYLLLNMPPKLEHSFDVFKEKTMGTQI